MKMKVSTTKQTQGALPELGREEKTMHWLIIGEGEDKYTLNVGKKSYEEVNKLIAKEAEKENPNLNLQKILVDLQKSVDNDLLVQDEKGGISFNPVKIGTQNDYLSKLLSKENAWKYSQGADELLRAIREGKGTPKEFFSQAKDKSQINWSANVPFYGKLNVEPNPETGLIPEGVMPKVELVGTPQEYVDIDGKKKTINVVSQKTMDDILFNDRLKTQFDYLWNTHKEEIKKTNPNFTVSPQNEEDLKRFYFSHILNDNGLPQPHISARTHLPPQPRISVRVGGNSDTPTMDIVTPIKDYFKENESTQRPELKGVAQINLFNNEVTSPIINEVQKRYPGEDVTADAIYYNKVGNDIWVMKANTTDENDNPKIDRQKDTFVFKLDDFSNIIGNKQQGQKSKNKSLVEAQNKNSVSGKTEPKKDWSKYKRN